jgi:hypothetical protein
MRRLRIILAISALSGASALLALPAAAATPAPIPALAPPLPPLTVASAQATVIPQDVTAYIASRAVLDYVHSAFPTPEVTSSEDSNDTPLPDLSAADGFGPVHELYAFSDAFASGADTSQAIADTSTWVASIHSPAGSLGYIQLWKPAVDAAPQLGLNANAELAALVDKAPQDAVLIEDAPSGEWFTATQSTLTPLNKQAALEVPSAAPIDNAQNVIAKRYAFRASQAAKAPGAMGGVGALYDHRPWYQAMPAVPLATAAAVVLLGIAGLVIAIRLHRRHAKQ